MAVEAAVMLALARVLVLALPFHRIARRLAAREAGRLDRAGDAARVANMVAAAARAMPFRAKCLEQAIAAAVMLRRRGVRATIHLGTARDPDGSRFAAHAWLSVGGEVVLGGPVDRYIELTRF